VLPGSELLRDRIAWPYAGLPDRLALVPVTPADLHVTIQHLAPVGELTGAELAGIVSRVRQSCAGTAPFAVTAGRAQAWEHGIVCPVRPGYLLASLRQVTTSASRQVTADRFPVRPAAYHPHLSLAYATGHADQAPVQALLAGSNAPEVTFPVTRLVLVAQSHDRRRITFRILDEITLSGEPGIS
jgi:2'-5' RNA ligase